MFKIRELLKILNTKSARYYDGLLVLVLGLLIASGMKYADLVALVSKYFGV